MTFCPKRRRILVAAIAALWCGGVSCKRGAAAAEAVADHRYAMEGAVIGIDRDAKLVKVKHGPIRDAAGAVWMAAMTMEFPVRDEREFARLRVGQRIRATVYQREADFDYWLGGIEIDPMIGSPDKTKK